jgi:hypothetical protein
MLMLSAAIKSIMLRDRQTSFSISTISITIRKLDTQSAHSMLILSDLIPDMVNAEFRNEALYAKCRNTECRGTLRGAQWPVF